MRSRVVILLLFSLLLSCRGVDERIVRSRIAGDWEATLRFNPSDTPDSLIGLPKPYTVPCIEGMFNELYYWDTFFTNEGLIADGLVQLAADNTEDILYLIDKYGFMPNGNRLWYLTRSQQPYAALMVGKVFDATCDTLWLSCAYPVLEKEYAFWMEQRSTPTGLNRFGWTDPSDELVEEFITTAGRRLGKDFRAQGMSPGQLRKFGLDCIAECESGWDFNPRFHRRCSDYCPVDLNATLYGVEMEMSRFASVLGMDSEVWKQRAASRKARMIELFYDPLRNGFFDYDYVNGERSDVVSAAVFSLLYNKVLDEDGAAAVRDMLPAMEYPSGISVCAEGDYGYEYQWSYPNCWPPCIYLAVEGFHRYGYDEDAARIAGKYIDATLSLYRSTGKLWEKYDCTDASMPLDKEYDTPEMMGWTAGVFVCMDEYLNNKI